MTTIPTPRRVITHVREHLTDNAAWAVLLLSAALEATWATALGASQGFTHLGPTLLFALTAPASMIGLSLGMLRIPVGTAYAVWTGLGAVLTVGYAATTGTELLTTAKILALALIVGCTIGLKATHPHPPEPQGTSTPPTP